jgi:MinD-like ATPase involved in chromosome partitioning or flagellar assembly
MLRRVAREIRKVTGASQDAYLDATLADAIQQPVTTGRRIAVTSIRGGAGKSVIAALVATALAHFRQDRVLALDADPGIGSLMLRLGMTSAPSLRHLVAGEVDATSFDAVRSYLAQTDAGVWALGGTDDRFGQVNLASYRAATNLLGRFFGVTVIDCGAGLTGELYEGVLADAHSQVMVSPATPDGVISARRALELLATDRPELAPRTTVVFVAHAAGAGVDPDRAVATMSPWCRRVEHLAFDRHLADGSLIDPARLAEPTRITALRIAGAALTLAAGRGLPQ